MTPPTTAERVYELVNRRATGIQMAYLRDDSNAVASLALLRRGAGQRPGQDIRLIQLTVADLYPENQTLPDEPQPAELAVFAALTLFAVHQQSRRDKPMHQHNHSFGRSARLLGHQSGSQAAVRARFTAIATASSWDERIHHTRSLIQQFRAFGIPLDYGRFAVDLLRLQSQRTADSVRLAWGRDFYRFRSSTDDGSTSDENLKSEAADN